VTDRRMERICLSTLKQLDTALETWAFMEASESRYMPRSRTDLTDCTKSVPTRVGCRGIWCCRRLVAHHSTSVFAVQCSVADGCCASTTRRRQRSLTCFLSEKPLPTDRMYHRFVCRQHRDAGRVVPLDEQNEVCRVSVELFPAVDHQPH